MAHDQIDVALIGTTRVEHLTANIRRLETELPVKQSVVQELYRRLDKVGGDWRQLG